MIIYIPWTDEILLCLWNDGKSYLFSKDSCEQGTMTMDSIKKFKWIVVGSL